MYIAILECNKKNVDVAKHLLKYSRHFLKGNICVSKNHSESTRTSFLNLCQEIYKNWTLIKLSSFHDKIFPVNCHQVCSWLVVYTMFLPEVLYGCFVEGWEEFDFREEEPEPEWLRLCLSKLRWNERGLQRRFSRPTWVLTWDGLRLSLWFWALDSYSSADVFL